MDSFLLHPARHARLSSPAGGGGDAAGLFRLGVDVERSGFSTLKLAYVVCGAVERLVAPPADGEMERADDLWRTTCFEVFVRAQGNAYTEFNFAPSTRWAAYRFEDYRRGMASVDVATPDLSVEREARRFVLIVELDLGRVPELAGKPWRIGLSAVIEDTSGDLSYWALAHPAGKPDFHHPDSFVLTLDPP